MQDNGSQDFVYEEARVATRHSVGLLSHPRSVVRAYARSTFGKLTPHGADRRALPWRAWLEGMLLLCTAMQQHPTRRAK